MPCSWVDEDRISMAASPSHREAEQKLYQHLTTLSKDVDKVTNTVSKLAEISKKSHDFVKKQERYNKIESDIQEEQVTKAVESYYKMQGYEVVKLPIKDVFNRQGNTVTDVDGFSSVSKLGHESVVLIEAKHRVTRDDVDERVEKNRIVMQLMAELREEPALPALGHQLWRLTAGQLWQFRYCDPIWFMAGALFSEGMRAKAQARGFGLVLINGSRYSIQAAPV